MTQIPAKTDQMSLIKDALNQIKVLKTKLHTLEKAKNEPIAIIGMSCRFPQGANSPETFWELLQSGTDAISEIPPQRWNIDNYYDPKPDARGKVYTRHGGFLNQPIDQFDADFFWSFSPGGSTNGSATAITAGTSLGSSGKCGNITLKSARKSNGGIYRHDDSRLLPF